MKTTVFELSVPFETVTFIGPGAVTSVAGTGTEIVVQFPERHGTGGPEGLSMSLPKCTVVVLNRPWPLRTKLKFPLPAGKLDGRIVPTDGGVRGGGVAIDPPQPDNAVEPRMGISTRKNEKKAWR